MQEPRLRLEITPFKLTVTLAEAPGARAPPLDDMLSQGTGEPASQVRDEEPTFVKTKFIVDGANGPLGAPLAAKPAKGLISNESVNRLNRVPSPEWPPAAVAP